MRTLVIGKSTDDANLLQAIVSTCANNPILHRYVDDSSASMVRYSAKVINNLSCGALQAAYTYIARRKKDELYTNGSIITSSLKKHFYTGGKKPKYNDVAISTQLVMLVNAEVGEDK